MKGRDNINNLIIRQINNTEQSIDINALINDFYKNIDVNDATIKTYRKGIKHFLNWIKDQNIQRIDKSVMLSYKKHLQETFKDTTASTYLSGIRNLFNFLEELGIPNVMRNIKGIKISKQFRKQPLNRDQTLKVIDNFKLETLKDYRDFTMFKLLLFTLRTIEIHRADKTDITNIGGQFVLKIQGKGKTDKEQYIVLTDDVLIPLLKYLELRGDDQYAPLFISLSSNCYGKRLSTKSISKIVKNVLVSNGYNSKELTAHSLRHTGITFSLLGGATIQEAKELSRHADINTTLIYSHNIDRIGKAPERYIENYLKGGGNNDKG